MKKLERISLRIPLIVVLAAALAALAVGAFSYHESSLEVRDQATQKLVALRVARQSALIDYFAGIEDDIQLLATGEDIRNMLADFRTKFDSHVETDRASGEETLRNVFRKDSIAGDPAGLDYANSQTLNSYFDTHERYHSRLLSITKAKGYYDIFLISDSGDIVYTAFKEDDFGTNLKSGKWSDTGLSEVYRNSIDSGNIGKTVFVDFEKYEPSAGAPAAFAAHAITIGGDVVGVLAIQLPIDRISHVMQVTAGMGDSGETYVVGPDKLMRSNSRFSEETTILKRVVDTVAVERAFDGETGTDVIDDYRGVPVVSAYEAFRFNGLDWALLAEIDVAEVNVPIAAMRDTILLIGLGLTLLIAGVGYLLAGTITRPLSDLARAISDFGRSRYAIDLPHTNRSDEIGEIARGFEKTAEDVSSYIDSINEARDELRRNEAELVGRQNKLESILRSAADAIVTIDSSSKIVSWSGAAEKIFGWGGPEVLGRDFQLIFRQGKTAVADPNQSPDESGKDISVFNNTVSEQPAFTKSGTTITVELSVSEWVEESEVYYTAIIRDITDRKAAQDAIARSQGTFHALVEQLPASVAIKDLDDRYIFVNSKFKSWFMSNPLDVVGQNSDSVYTPELVEELRELDKRVIETKTSITREIHQTFSDGSDHILEMTKFPVLGADGVAIAVAAIDFDITEIKRAEKLIAEQDTILEMATENMPGAILVCDPDQRIAFVSKGYADLYGTPTHLLKPGTNIEDVLKNEIDRGVISGEESKEKLLKDRIRSFQANETYHYEDKKEDGGTIMTTRNPGPNGYTVTMSIDISDHKQAEVALKAALKQSEFFNRMSINRELRMIELKKEVDELAAKYGEKPRYS